MRMLVTAAPGITTAALRRAELQGWNESGLQRLDDELERFSA